MTPAIDVLQKEASTGFRRLVGTCLTASVPLHQALINHALSRLAQAPPGLAVDVLPGNRVVARYGLARVAAVLDEVVRLDGEPPRITVELASGVVAWALKQTLRLPAVTIVGRRVTIDAGALDGLAACRAYWPLLRSVRLRTTPGHVHVDFEVVVG